MATKEKDQSDEETGGVALKEKTKEHKWDDDDLVSVWYGHGLVAPGYKQKVDKIAFEDGIARNVPYAFVRHWQKGTRPDGKREQVYGKISIQAVLDNDATEADFCKATGITIMPVERFATMIAGVNLDELAAQLGTEKLKALIAGLEKHLPDQKRGA
jgi:hypothetical protein